MDGIKLEPDIDPLAAQEDDRNGEDEESLSCESNSCKVDASDIKEEPYDIVADIKDEENEVSVTYPVLKSEVLDDRSKTDAIKEEPLQDMVEEDDDMTNRINKYRHLSAVILNSLHR
ncbi:uncharacterized protein [Periplaneta americana]|uniref:uncharacterized protein isoform X3 n=1 Tax=Periplaneta americana TaxID=6978 RepID=UPI0037E8E668